VELALLSHSGTNPTAAAVAALRILGALDEQTRARAAAFLARLQTPAGGWRANTQIPWPDLLSTFTGLVALRDLEDHKDVNLAAARGFVAALETPLGGFLAAPVDDTVDVEYTFYGLGTLAILNLF
jgi:geranylgeranyl transferase type-2 subunit beta